MKMKKKVLIPLVAWFVVWIKETAVMVVKAPLVWSYKNRQVRECVCPCEREKA